MKKLDVLKWTLQTAGGIGAAFLVGYTIKKITPENMKLFAKITVGFAGIMIAWKAEDEMSKYIGETFDYVVEMQKDIQKQIEEKRELYQQS